MKVKVKKLHWTAQLSFDKSKIVEEKGGQRLIGSDKVLKKYPNNIHPTYKKYGLPF